MSSQRYKPMLSTSQKVGCGGCALIPILFFYFVWRAFGAHELLGELASIDRETVEDADRIEVVRIEPIHYPVHLKKPGLMNNVRATSPGVVLNEGARHRLVDIFKRANYSITRQGCEGLAGVVFRFSRQGRTVDAAYDVFCGAVYLFPPGAMKSFPRYIGNSAELLSVATEAFPKDKDLLAP